MGFLMALKTRLDHRVRKNRSIKLVHPVGEAILAEIVLLDSIGNIEITTVDGIYIQKPNGWTSKDKRC